MARFCWAPVVLQVWNFGPHRNIGLRPPLPARHAGALHGCAISAYKLYLHPFRPGTMGPARTKICSTSYHIISFRPVGRVKFPHRPPARKNIRSDSVPRRAGLSILTSSIRAR